MNGNSDDIDHRLRMLGESWRAFECGTIDLKSAEGRIDDTSLVRAAAERFEQEAHELSVMRASRRQWIARMFAPTALAVSAALVMILFRNPGAEREIDLSTRARGVSNEAGTRRTEAFAEGPDTSALILADVETAYRLVEFPLGDGLEESDDVEDGNSDREADDDIDDGPVGDVALMPSYEPLAISPGADLDNEGENDGERDDTESDQMMEVRYDELEDESIE